MGSQLRQRISDVEMSKKRVLLLSSKEKKRFHREMCYFRQKVKVRLRNAPFNLDTLNSSRLGNSSCRELPRRLLFNLNTYIGVEKQSLGQVSLRDAAHRLIF